MKAHTKKWLKSHDYAPGEFIPCHECGSKSVDLHHVKFRSHGGTDEPDNIIPLCRKCHDKLHTKTIRK
jgi:5-methylcytosine-specific restriction endonuclease McrA